MNPEQDFNVDNYDEEYGTSDDEYGEMERRKRISDRKYQQSKEEIQNTDEEMVQSSDLKIATNEIMQSLIMKKHFEAQFQDKSKSLNQSYFQSLFKGGK